MGAGWLTLGADDWLWARMACFGRGMPPFGRGMLPFGRGMPPFDAECLPLDAECLPLDAECLPLDAECLPLDAECLPLDAECLPLDAECLPLDARCLALGAGRLTLGVNLPAMGAEWKALDAASLPTKKAVTESRFSTFWTALYILFIIQCFLTKVFAHLCEFFEYPRQFAQPIMYVFIDNTVVLIEMTRMRIDEIRCYETAEVI